MLFQRINRTDPEKVFVIAKNSYASALAAGYWVSWDAATDMDGIAVDRPTAELGGICVAGVADGAIAAGEYGLIQVWGYRADARCSGGSGLGTSKLSAGVGLMINTSGHCCFEGDATAFNLSEELAVGFFMTPANTAAKATSATTWIGKVFIKCL